MAIRLRSLRRTGELFWNAESYDHCVRDERENWRKSYKRIWRMSEQRLDTIVEAADTSVRATAVGGTFLLS